jgi:hypothetical protein
MPKGRRIQKVRDLLREAKNAHSKFEEIQGKPDSKWPEWYADYLLSKGISDIVGTTITEKELTDVIKEAEAKRIRSSNWVFVYAKAIFNKFNNAYVEA